jgi:outer membrane protein OmpA-like peptidoglycan-associated protein
MRRRIPLPAPRPLAALALAVVLVAPLAHGAQAQAGADQPAPAIKPSGSAAAAHSHPARLAAKPAPLVVPAAPPPPPVLPPPVAVPTRPPPPTPPAPVVADAPGEASKSASGLRVTFGAGRFDLNPESNQSITARAQAAPGPDASFTVTGYAPGGDDPSTPRRLSLSRALAVRSALMQAGIKSVHIYVKALGASAPNIAEGPPDRVDIEVTAAPAPATQSGTVPTPPPPAPAAPPATPAPPPMPPAPPVPTQKAAP